MITGIQVDTHTHSVLSGHAWSTITENARAAAAKGLTGICLTEHGPEMQGCGPEYLPQSQQMLPRVIEGITAYRGTEANIVTAAGNLDIRDDYLFGIDFGIASIHDPAVGRGNSARNTDAFLAALNHPRIDVLGHPEDVRIPCDLEVLVKEAAKLGKPMEVNNNTLLGIRPGSGPNLELLARLCLKHGVGVCVTSDAHFAAMIGQVDVALALLNKLSFPAEMVFNRSRESFEDYLARRSWRMSKAG